MPEEGRTAITVDLGLWNRIKALPLEDLGYKTPTEFARAALREKIESTTRDPRNLRCPTCGAPAGSPCVRPSGYVAPLGILHAARREAAQRAQEASR